MGLEWPWRPHGLGTSSPHPGLSLPPCETQGVDRIRPGQAPQGKEVLGGHPGSGADSDLPPWARDGRLWVPPSGHSWLARTRTQSPDKNPGAKQESQGCILPPPGALGQLCDPGQVSVSLWALVSPAVRKAEADRGLSGLFEGPRAGMFRLSWPEAGGGGGGSPISW